VEPWKGVFQKHDSWTYLVSVPTSSKQSLRHLLVWLTLQIAQSSLYVRSSPYVATSPQESQDVLHLYMQEAPTWTIQQHQYHEGKANSIINRVTNCWTAFWHTSKSDSIDRYWQQYKFHLQRVLGVEKQSPFNKSCWALDLHMRTKWRLYNPQSNQWPTFHGIGEDNERVDVIDWSLKLIIVDVEFKIGVLILGIWKCTHLSNHHRATLQIFRIGIPNRLYSPSSQALRHVAHPLHTRTSQPKTSHVPPRLSHHAPELSMHAKRNPNKKLPTL
jgi:hypothetical protein